MEDPDRKGEEEDSDDGEVGETVHQDHQVHQLALLDVGEEQHAHVDQEDEDTGQEDGAPVKRTRLEVPVHLQEVILVKGDVHGAIVGEQ